MWNIIIHGVIHYYEGKLSILNKSLKLSEDVCVWKLEALLKEAFLQNVVRWNASCKEFPLSKGTSGLQMLKVDIRYTLIFSFASSPSGRQCTHFRKVKPPTCARVRNLRDHPRATSMRIYFPPKFTRTRTPKQRLGRRRRARRKCRRDVRLGGRVLSPPCAWLLMLKCYSS